MVSHATHAQTLYSKLNRALVKGGFLIHVMIICAFFGKSSFTMRQTIKLSACETAYRARIESQRTRPVRVQPLSKL